ncbi:MAG: arylesterase [Hyphomicrobium sp.]
MNMILNAPLSWARLLLVLALFAAPALTMISQQTKADSPPSVTLVAFGDSLTAGYMLPPGDSFPSQLQVALAAKGYKVNVINAGVSGDTSAGGLQRLDWSMQPGVEGVILELGANDALRGIDPNLTKNNLEKIIAKIKQKGADILLAGMKAPANWGPEYQATFDVIYPELAGRYQLALYPFFLEGVIGEPGLTLDDGLHPTTKGVAELVKRILPQVEALVKQIQDRKAAATATAKP